MNNNRTYFNWVSNKNITYTVNKLKRINQYQNLINHLSHLRKSSLTTVLSS
jgi:hypothetical protein